MRRNHPAAADEAVAIGGEGVGADRGALGDGLEVALGGELGELVRGDNLADLGEALGAGREQGDARAQLDGARGAAGELLAPRRGLRGALGGRGGGAARLVARSLGGVSVVAADLDHGVAASLVRIASRRSRSR